MKFAKLSQFFPLKPLFLGLIRVYQWGLSPIMGHSCRFSPRCSDYAQDAIQKHGALKGGFLAAKRILRCNPWHPGGQDPVP